MAIRGVFGIAWVPHNIPIDAFLEAVPSLQRTSSSGVDAGKLKQQFANLTDDDLLFQDGKEEELLGRLQKKLGKSKEELRKMIAKL